MLFSSYAFLLIFLPAVWALYFLLQRRGAHLAALWFLLLASFFFYAYWNIWNLPIFIASLIFNYAAGSAIERSSRNKKVLLIAGIAANLGALALFKYADFFITNLDAVTGLPLTLLNIALPLGISFFTFQQIAYLVDTYRGDRTRGDFLSYALFVGFFPHLIAGPITHHREMIPQFTERANWRINYPNVAAGLFMLSVGLFKKTCVADFFSPWVAAGFDTGAVLSFFEAWISAISYAFQIYFDFSAYSDMAIGLGLLFNIRFPVNFNAPYRAVSIADFWKRWHITLSRFLKEYLYIPLGGNRKGDMRTYLNTVAVFFIGGLWHGAAWTYVLWGLFHGLGAVLFTVWKRLRVPLPAALSRALTFLFVVVAWVFFRSPDVSSAFAIVGSMFGGSIRAISEPFAVLGAVEGSAALLAIMFAASLYAVFSGENTAELVKRFRPEPLWLLLSLALMLLSLYAMNGTGEFIYFNF